MTNWCLRTAWPPTQSKATAWWQHCRLSTAPLGTLLQVLGRLPPRDRTTEYERALHLVGLLQPDQRVDLAGTLVNLLRYAVIHDVPAAERAGLCERSLRLMGEETDQHWTPQEQADWQALQRLVPRPPARWGRS